MNYLKNLMLAIVSAIMGTVSASLFEGWTAKDQKVVFFVSVLMMAVMLSKSSIQSNGSRRKKNARHRKVRKRKSRRGNKKKGHGP